MVTLGAPWPRTRIASWAHAETRFLARVHHAGTPVLGICFGAQLLAEALGADTVPLRAPRIGWHPVVPLDSSMDPGPWFQWHAEQLTAPRGAEVVAESIDGVEAFRAGRAVGLQFHPEMTPALLERWLALPGGAPPEIDVAALRAATGTHGARAPEAARTVIDLL